MIDIKVLASGSSGNCYLIDNGKTKLLLDAGIPFKQIQKGCDFRTSDISGCLITHRHGDHAKAIKDLIKRGMPVYGPNDLQEINKNILVLKPLIRYTIGTFIIVPFEVKHDVECYGYQISSMGKQKLIYVTDTAYIKYQFTELTHIMIEANYDSELIRKNTFNMDIQGSLASRIIQSHMSLETVEEFLAANDLSKVQQIYLLHLSDNNSNAAEFKDRIQRKTGAEVYVY